MEPAKRKTASEAWSAWYKYQLRMNKTKKSWSIYLVVIRFWKRLVMQKPFAIIIAVGLGNTPKLITKSWVPKNL